MAKKSAEKSATGRPFEGRLDARNGKGPVPGAPNAGRPASEIVLACRSSFAERLHVAEGIADDPSATNIERLKALTLLGRFGGILNVQKVEPEAPPPERQCMKFGDQIIWFVLVLCLLPPMAALATFGQA